MELTRRGLLKSLGVAAGAVATSQVLVPKANAAAAPAAPAAAASLGTVKINRIKINKPVYSGTSTKVLNRGGFGHWVGSAKPGKSGHTILFAHRTSAGGPLRNAHKLKIGDTIVVNKVTYRVRAKEIIKGNNRARALSYGRTGKRLSLITCTKLNGLPTSTKYRLVIRATA